MGQDGLGGLEGLGLVGDEVVLHGLVVPRLARPHAGPQEERGPGVEAEQVHAVLRHLQLQRLGHGLQPRLGGRVHRAQRQPDVSWLVSRIWSEEEQTPITGCLWNNLYVQLTGAIVAHPAPYHHTAQYRVWAHGEDRLITRLPREARSCPSSCRVTSAGPVRFTLART